MQIKFQLKSAGASSGYITVSGSAILGKLSLRSENP